MTSSEMDRLHRRIDELVARIAELGEIVARSLAACDTCRPFVMGGNGKPSLSDRMNEVQREIADTREGLVEKIAGMNNEITALKTAREIGGREFWAGVGITGTVSGAVVGALLKWWLGAAG